MLLRLPDKLQKAAKEEKKKEKVIFNESKEEPKKAPKRAKKGISDEELSLKVFDLFSRYKTRLITCKQELEEFAALSQEFGIDTETSGLNFYKDHIAGFSIGTDKESAYIPLRHERRLDGTDPNYQDDFSTIYDILKDKDLYGFNWKFDKHFLLQEDSRFKDVKVKDDGYLLARVMDNRMDAGLKPLYKKFIDPEVEDYSFSSLFNRPYTTYDPVLVYPYAAVDAQKHLILTKFLREKMQREFPEQYRLYAKLELPVTEVVCKMEEHGIKLDVPRVYSLTEELEEEAEGYLRQIKDLLQDEEFNPSSPKQVKEKFRELGFDLASTGEKELEAIKSKHPLPNLLLDYRGAKKLSGTYGTNLLEYTDSLGVAHPIFNSLGTDTGRFSSTRFNAQNIPKDNRFRNLFIPKKGNKLISVDYSQQEVRILAAMAKDPAMIEAFRSGKDFYAVMASLAFNLPYEKCTKHSERADLRGHMKSVVLGLNYDMGMPTLAETLHKTVEEATDIYKRFQQTCPGVDDFKKKCKEFAYKHGYAETILKRRRYFEGVGYKALGLPRFECENKDVLLTLEKIQHDRFAVRRLLEDAKKEGVVIKDRERLAFMEERQCTNSVIQGSAGDETKLAMVAFDNDPVAKELDAHIVLQIHDEIIIECPAENAEKAGERLAFIMNGVMEELFDIPGGAVPDIMDRWTKE